MEKTMKTTIDFRAASDSLKKSLGLESSPVAIKLATK
jgi:hypothetical protein